MLNKFTSNIIKIVSILILIFLLLTIFVQQGEIVEAENIEVEEQYNSLDIVEDIEVDPYEEQRKEFPVATDVWIFLKENDFSDIQCAGLLGNMMVECGGNTLNLQPLSISKDNHYYGICQWSKKYYSDVWYQDTKQQCLYLISNIEQEINTFGSNYRKAFKYQDFRNLQDEKQIALAFAKCYERCGVGSYSARMKCASVALDYFT